jgi:ribonuclease P protein component
MRKPAEFQAALGAGRRLHEPPLTAAVSANGIAHARLGLAIAARAVPRAVDRNRIKRQARETFRRRAAELPAVDVVILARPAAARAPAPVLRLALERLWLKVAACAPR